MIIIGKAIWESRRHCLISFICTYESQDLFFMCNIKMLIMPGVPISQRAMRFK